MSASQRARRLLDAPFRDRPLFWQCLTPVLVSLAFLVAVVACLRRVCGRADFVLQRKRCLVICVGNVLMGGTGKSPIVRAIARDYLSRGFRVGILTRGVGRKEASSSSEVVAVSRAFPDSLPQVESLSDEAREHFEVLSAEFPSETRLHVLEGRRRADALRLFVERTESLREGFEDHTLAGLRRVRHVVILDDGLTHFACPRHLNLAVWDTPLMARAPLMPFPAGPFREGFGRQTMGFLMDLFDARLWTRTEGPEGGGTLSARAASYGMVFPVLRRLHRLPMTRRDVFVRGRFIMREWPGTLGIPTERTRGTSLLAGLVETQGELEVPAASLALCGIAGPERFLGDLALRGVTPAAVVCVDDHGPLTKAAFDNIARAEVCFLTAKDTCRWSGDAAFISALADKKVYICFKEVHLEALAEDLGNFSLWLDAKAALG